ncbi:MAG TPA: phosphoribosylanthranilate isomerase [Erythrobacter sp.]|nr:phosphoribosylanthranilate isomerase [Erythrobacter sp.]
MATQIKICGLSTPEAIDVAVDAGATHIGLNLYEPSPRYIPLDRAKELAEYARGRIKTVLLLVNADAELTTSALTEVRPDVVQFHGSETPEWVDLVREKVGIETWKAVGLRDAGTLERCAKFTGNVDRLLFDAPAKALPGGTGETFAWDLLAGYQHQVDWALAGGLTPENVATAIHQTGAPKVDTSSGVESAAGVKDMDLIRAFCKAAQNA